MPANKTALLTVGSTEFTPLVQAALGDDVQAALTGSGFTQFTVQYGKSRLGKGYDIGYSSAGVVRTVQRAGISIHLLPFVADIEQRMASSDLVISHAGAGSVLASLRGPALSPLSASSKPVPQLIVVPNDSLMDSHQSDLAEQLDSRGWATCWTRLVRFVAKEDGKEYYGDALLPSGQDDVGKVFQSGIYMKANTRVNTALMTVLSSGKLQARVLSGDPLSSSCKFATPQRTLGVKRLLPPVDVQRYGASIRCLGTNYPIAGAKKPPIPILFYKPYSSLAGFGDPIVIPREVQDQSDYEVELVIVIGKGGRNIPVEKALDHIIGDVQKVRLTTHLKSQPSAVNPVQDGSTNDMLWQVAETVSALSYGTTLRVGDIICTGTPPGQGSGRTPPLWLKDGEVVTVFGEGIGSLENPIAWEQDTANGVATVGPPVKAKL
ncbi:hypothetical protein EMMF5_001351 [Cystobasidiomycetes sp. EMM_F5]